MLLPDILCNSDNETRVQALHADAIEAHYTLLNTVRGLV